MPEIVVYAVGNRPAEQKAALCKDITDAMVKNYKVPADAVVITLVETPKTDKAKGGVMFSDMPARLKWMDEQKIERQVVGGDRKSVV